MSQATLFAPDIIRYYPAQSGVDNAGIGETAHGERFLLKTDATVCLAEYVGASLCQSVGVPCGQPAVVNYRGRKAFGSRLEAGVESPSSDAEIIDLVRECGNKTIFSAVLAADLAIGNNDRHWGNWLYQRRPDGSVIARAIDFSRAWPTVVPPLECHAMRGHNTQTSFAIWPGLGITYDETTALNVCSTLERMNGEWLSDLFEDLPVDWMISGSGPELCAWWGESWAGRVAEVRDFLKSGAWQ
ncbi:hypothetical protein [Paraburkholderia saeva]|nr:hypothetical protein [Paraburkholderia saeva]